MRQLDADPARGAEDGLAGANVDLVLVDGEGIGFVRDVGAHCITVCALPSSSASS
jgi:hypothetical protein